MHVVTLFFSNDNNNRNNKGDKTHLDGVLPSPVPLDQADDKADAKEEDDGEQHPDEPAWGGEGALLRLVPGRDVQVRVHALNKAVVISDV